MRFLGVNCLSGKPAVICRLVLLLSFFCTALSASDEQTRLLRKFRTTRIALAPPNADIGKMPNLAIRLDEEFYSMIKDLSNDLRIINADNQNIPFALQRVTGDTKVSYDQQLPGRIIRQQPQPDGRIFIDYELDAASKEISVVELEAAAIQPGTRLTIAVGEANNLQTAIDQFALADTSRWPEITRRRFLLPRNFSGKLLRLTISGGKIGKLDAVKVYTSEERLQPETSLLSAYKVRELERKSDNRVLEILLETSNLPLTQFKITSSSACYLCKVTVAASDDRKNWKNIANGSISKIDMDSIQTLDFPETRARYMLIRIENLSSNVPASLAVQSLGNTYEWLLPVNRNTLQTLTIYYNAAGKIPRQRQNPDLQPGKTSGYYQLGEASRNRYYDGSVTDRRTWRHLVGALVIIFCGIAAAIVLIKLPEQKKLLPED